MLGGRIIVPLSIPDPSASMTLSTPQRPRAPAKSLRITGSQHRESEERARVSW